MGARNPFEEIQKHLQALSRYVAGSLVSVDHFPDVERLPTVDYGSTDKEQSRGYVFFNGYGPLLIAKAANAAEGWVDVVIFDGNFDPLRDGDGSAMSVRLTGRVEILASVASMEWDKMSAVERYLPKQLVNDVYTHPDCTFNYCPHPEDCRPGGRCTLRLEASKEEK